MKRILFALLALMGITLCACSSEPSGAATATTTPSATPTAAAFDAVAAEKTLIEIEKKTWEIYKDKTLMRIENTTHPIIKFSTLEPLRV